MHNKSPCKKRKGEGEGERERGNRQNRKNDAKTHI
jgi:hypothetical protein